MSPSGNIGMELPPPVGEQLSPINLPEKTGQTHEQQTASPLESAPSIIANQPLPPPPPLNIPSSITPQPISDDNASSDDSQSSLIADDGDLIEKEWVNKAKAIVEQTREDPYRQSEELGVLRADYLQKRYSKTLKQST